jgi:hypothetical protein
MKTPSAAINVRMIESAIVAQYFTSKLTGFADCMIFDRNRTSV